MNEATAGMSLNVVLYLRMLANMVAQCWCTLNVNGYIDALHACPATFLK